MVRSTNLGHWKLKQERLWQSHAERASRNLEPDNNLSPVGRGIAWSDRQSQIASAPMWLLATRKPWQTSTRDAKRFFRFSMTFQFFGRHDHAAHRRCSLQSDVVSSKRRNEDTSYTSPVLLLDAPTLYTRTIITIRKCASIIGSMVKKCQAISFSTPSPARSWSWWYIHHDVSRKPQDPRRKNLISI